jgi:hypothetical protein
MVCKGVGQEGSSGFTSHALGSAKECEGMNPHTPKELLVDFQIFRGQLQWSKPNGFKISLYHWKAIEA